MFTRRVEDYVELWEGALEKFRRSDYHAEDLLTDWFQLCGNALRDATAISTLIWRAAGTSVSRPPAGKRP
jgi:hypothetical protein